MGRWCDEPAGAHGVMTEKRAQQASSRDETGGISPRWGCICTALACEFAWRASSESDSERDEQGSAS